MIILFHNIIQTFIQTIISAIINIQANKHQKYPNDENNIAHT